MNPIMTLPFTNHPSYPRIPPHFNQAPLTTAPLPPRPKLKPATKEELHDYLQQYFSKSISLRGFCIENHLRNSILEKDATLEKQRADPQKRIEAIVITDGLLHSKLAPPSDAELKP
jgi:hypothetical protein